MRDYVISLNRACLSDSPSPSLDILVSFTYPCRPTQFSSSLPHPVCPLSTVPSLLITYHPPLDSLLLLLSFIVIFQFGRIWRLYFTLISSFLAQAMFLWVSQKHSSFPLQTSLFQTLLSSLFLASFSLCMFSVCSHKLSVFFFMNPKHIYLVEIPGLMSPTSVLHQSWLPVCSLLLFLPCFEISCERRSCYIWAIGMEEEWNGYVKN